MTGYVAMRRDWQDHDVFGRDEFSRRDAWAWLISQAAWKPSKVRIKGSSVMLDRGQLCFSQRFLAEKWGWSKSKVDRFIATLREEGMIETRSKIGATANHAAGQGQSIITICNYEKFQSPLKEHRGNAEPESGATAGQQRGKEEEGNKIIPLANANGGDPEKAFWANAKSLIGPHHKGDPGAMISKWIKAHGKELTMAAFSAAQIANAFNPVEYIQGYFRRNAPVARVEPRVGALG